MYDLNNSSVKWNSSKSTNFQLGNGIKQGGVFSPALFNVYLERLLINLRKTNIGCHIGQICANSFAYADDIVLLSPTLNGIKLMIKVCEEFSTQYSIDFNPSKCSLMFFKSDSYDNMNYSDIQMFGKVIPRTDNYKHLGHIVSDKKYLIDVDGVINEMKTKTNVMRCKFGHLNLDSRIKLFNSHCLSLYGCELFDLQNRKINDLCVAWRVCCRNIAKLPYRTHSVFIHDIFKTNDIRDILSQRILNFIIKGVNHENYVVKSIFRNSLINNCSYLCRNLNIIKRKLNIDYDRIFENRKIIIKSPISIESWRLNLIREILNCIDGYGFVEIDQTILKNTLYFICTE